MKIIKLVLVLLLLVFLGSISFADKKIIYYRNPMNPKITSPVPLKDSMGMDYVPVYATETGKNKGVQIPLEKQKLLGIEKTEVKVRELAYEIKAAGKVAYDNELYVAQQEYLSALQAQEVDLVQAAEQRLRLSGMSQAEIKKLTSAGKPDQSLYLPDATAWVYLAIYEQDAGLVNPGQPVIIETATVPGKEFKGEIGGISPILDPDTRSVKVRVKVANAESKLRPEMFVNATIKVSLGAKLAVPVSAVIDTGTRKIVFKASGEDRFIQKEINIGHQAGDYYEVISGLRAGDLIVKSGSFYIDSESKLRAN